MTKELPYIVGIGGTTAENSSSERALIATLDYARSCGCEAQAFTSSALDFPNYGSRGAMAPQARQLVEEIRRCDALIISTPAYHGVMSGMIKNALDCIEELRSDPRPYLDGRVVGTIVCAYGEQAMGTTLSSLRSVVHALRGWPTPIGVTINSHEQRFGSDGHCSDQAVEARLRMLADQVIGFARMAKVA